MIGKKILHYQITAKLGQGGMGVVYRARDTKLDREVAIKFLPRHVAADDVERKRFEIEARAAAALNHPNIATVHAIEEADDEIFIVMELIEGKELREAIEEENYNPSVALNYAIQIAKGLQAAHDKGIVHRDIKSTNIMVTKDNQIKVMDFGLARLEGSAQITRVGTTLGTVAYMSPEQIQGGEVDNRSDIWSFGVLLYELITKKMPFKGAYEQVVFYSIVNEEPTPIECPDADIPDGWEAIIMKCLEKTPDNRYQNVGEILNDLQLMASGDSSFALPLNGHSKTVGLKAQRFNSKHIKLGASIFAGIVFLMLLGNQLMNWLPFESVPERQHLMVLPIHNLGGDAQNQAFCDGLVETLTSKLTQLEQFHKTLWVVPSSEVRRLTIQSASEACKAFGVNLVVAGSFQKLGQKYRLTMNLIDAEDLRQLNSIIMDIPVDRIALLQDQSISRLLEMLNLELNPYAYQVLQAGATKVPGAYELYVKGIGYLQRYEDVKKLDTAIDYFQKAVDLDKKYALAYAGLGEAYWRKYLADRNIEWIKLAEKYSRWAYDLDSSLPEVNNAMGYIKLGTGKYAEAEAAYLKTLDIDPTNASAYRGLAKAYEAQNQLEKAEATFIRAIDLKPDYWGGYNDLGVFYYRYSRYKEAAEQFKQVINLIPDNDRGYNNLGGIYYMMREWDKAREMYERSLALRKTFRTYSNLGTLYYIQGDFEKAIEMYKACLEINDKDYRTWGSLANAYYWAPGKRELAEPTFLKAINMTEDALKINPKDADLMSELAGYYSMLGEKGKAKAVELAEKAISISPDVTEIQFRVAVVYEQIGDRDKALFWMKKALESGYSLGDIENQPDLKAMMKDQRFQKIKESVVNNLEKI